MPSTVQVQCRDYLVTTIQGLTTAGFEDAEIKARDRADDWERFPRGISIVTLGEIQGAGTNLKDDYGYRFLVLISRGTGKSWDEETETLSTLRTSIRNAFNNKRPSSIIEVFIAGVQDGTFLKDRPWKDNRSISDLIVTFWSRELR